MKKVLENLDTLGVGECLKRVCFFQILVTIQFFYVLGWCNQTAISFLHPKK